MNTSRQQQQQHKHDQIEESTAKATTNAWNGMTLIQLKKELRARGLKVSGKKAKLIERLESSDSD